MDSNKENNKQSTRKGCAAMQSNYNWWPMRQLLEAKMYAPRTNKTGEKCQITVRIQ